MQISTALPCRISVFTEGREVKLATLKPTERISHFNVPELQSVAREVEGTLIQIMRDAAG
jgi:hypothetical protein